MTSAPIALYRSEGIPAAVALTDGYRFELWRPSLTAHRPRGLPRLPYDVWWAFHALHVFSNRDYAMMLGWSGDQLVHYLGIFPRYFRFPFMARDDLQFGDLWTRPDHRGKGLAPTAMSRAMSLCARPGRRFWYITASDNLASQRAAERVGFTRVGEVERTRRFGLRVLGSFRPI